MADTISSSVQLNTSAQVITNYGTLQPSYPAFKNSFANGTGSGQADMAAFPVFTVPAGSHFDLVLSGGAVRMPNGAAFNPAKIKELSFFNTHASIKVTIDSTVTHSFTPWLAGTSPTDDVMPGSIYCRTYPTTGWTVTSGSADTIRFNNAGGTDVVVNGKLTGTSV